MKNSEQPIVPYYLEKGIRHPDLFLGLTKREYFAGHSGLLAETLLKEMSIPSILEFIGVGAASREYEYFIHYPVALAKMQLLLADELLKQLNESK